MDALDVLIVLFDELKTVQLPLPKLISQYLAGHSWVAGGPGSPRFLLPDVPQPSPNPSQNP